MVVPSFIVVWTSLASAFPADDAWMPVTRGGMVVAEPVGDGTPGGLDLVGDATQPALAWWSDPSSVAFRLHVAVRPSVAGLTNDTWAVVFDLDGDERVDRVLAVQGVGGGVTLYAGAGLTDGYAAGGPYSTLHTYDASLGDGVRVVEVGDGTAWIDVELPRRLWSDAGIGPTTPFRLSAMTSPGFFLLQAEDVGGCDGGTGPCLSIVASTGDEHRDDEDEDGSPLPHERWRFSNPLDADSDDDGVADGVDRGPLVCDMDRDGLPDGLELGITEPGPDTDLTCFRPDLDPSTTTDPSDADSDGGGLTDGREDLDADGVIGRWETDPADPSDDLDSDGDRIPDVIEGRGDPDGDGIPSAFDDDSDGDGMLDRDEGRADPDGDDLPAFLDPDADNDGLPDGLDGVADPDGDGLPAYLDADADNDGIIDGEEGADDFDGDRAPNHVDADADNDRRPDSVEGTGDADCDGLRDFLDIDDDGGFCDTDLPTGVVSSLPFDGSRRPVEPAGDATLTGGACASASGGGWMALLLAFAWRRRRRVGAGLIAAASVSSASAAEVDAQRLRFAVDGGRFLVAEDARLAEAGSFGAGVFVHHASRPVVLSDGDVEQVIVGSITTTTLVGHATPTRRFRFGMELPIHAGVRLNDGRVPAAIGDLRVSAKVGAFTHRLGAVAVVADLVLPTGPSDVWLGERVPIAGLGVVGRVDPTPWLALVGEVGARNGTGAWLGDGPRGPAVTGSGGITLAPVPSFWLLAEMDGDWTIGRRAPAVEALGAIRGRIGQGLLLTAGAGGGVATGFGAPAWRVIVGVGWMPGHTPADTADGPVAFR